MNTPVKTFNNEKGFVLITSLLILVVVMIIGIAATNTTILEEQIAGNDRVTKETFYASEGGLHIGAEIVEQSVWGIDEGDFTELQGGEIQQLENVFIVNEKVGENIIERHTTLHLLEDVEPDIDNDTPHIIFSYDGSTPDINTIPRTEIWMPGRGISTPGGALQQLAGYEGAGKGAATGGGARSYDLHTVTRGRNNSRTHLVVEWIHAL